MGENQHIILQKLIEEHGEIVEFGDFGEGTSGLWIGKAEEALGHPLSPSYKWWLRNYGGGEIAGDEIYSIYEENFDDVVGGDIVYMQRRYREEGLIGPSALVVCHSDIDGIFYFDLSVKSEDGEYPIVSATTGAPYASDFIDFLIKRIQVCAS